MKSCINLRYPLEWLSFNRVANSKEIWWTIGIAAALGALYGAFVNPLWSEAVEFAETWAGVVPYEHSPWGTIMLADPSLQITIPALLLLMGVKVWPLSMACTAFFCALSFSAIAASCFAYTRNSLLSIALPLLLLTFDFTNAHGYPVKYPVLWFQFGQTGMYLAVLALSLIACGWPFAAGVAGGLLAGVHTVWLPCFILGSFGMTFWLQPQLLKRLFFGCILGALLAIGLLQYGNSLMPHHQAYQPPFIPQTTPHPVSSESAKPDISVKPAIPANAAKSEAPRQEKVRGTFNAHNVLFADSRSPVKAALEFFMPEVVFLLLILALRYTERTYTFTSDRFHYAHRLIAAAAIPVIATALFKIYEEMDPYYTLIGLINKQLPSLVLRAIINRWLNLTNVLIPVMGIALMATQAYGRKSWPSIGAFAAFAAFEALGRKPNWYIGAFLIAAMIGHYLKGRKEQKIPVLMQVPAYVIPAIIVCFIALKSSMLTYEAVSEKHYAGSDAADALVSVTKKDPGTLIVSSSVISIRNFSPQLRTGRATIVPGTLDVYDKDTARTISIYCYNDPYIPLGKFYDSVKPCFENRPAHEWNIIARETHATGLITPDDWKLTITPVISSGGFAYYRFPVSEHN